ncbi:MAG: hypothetical protein JRG91_11315, partial [Deltaproteobacteria bacterium]|nr:hypothetical protein [Deltaproteobacteria bacterium]
MTEMFAPESFFDLEGFDHGRLFRGDEPVWTALDRLSGYLDSLFAKPWPLCGVSGAVERPLVIVDGALVDGAEVRTDGPKNSVQVFADGRRLEGAAVILPGAYLYDDRLILGPGTVVEPGALIKGPVVIG